MILVGFSECLSVGYFFMVDKNFALVGKTPVLFYNIMCLLGLIISCILSLSLVNTKLNENGSYTIIDNMFG